VNQLRRFPHEALLCCAFLTPEFSAYFEQVLAIPSFSLWIDEIHRINHYQILSLENSLNRYYIPPFALQHRLDFPDGTVSRILVETTRKIPNAQWDAILNVWKRYAGPKDILYYTGTIRAATLRSLADRLKIDPLAIKLYGIKQPEASIKDSYVMLTDLLNREEKPIQTAVGVGIQNLAVTQGYSNRESMEVDFLRRAPKTKRSFRIPKLTPPDFLTEEAVLDIFSRYLRYQTPIPNDVIKTWIHSPSLFNNAATLIFIDGKNNWGLYNWDSCTLNNGKESSKPTSTLRIAHPIVLHTLGYLDQARELIKRKYIQQAIAQVMRPIYPLRRYPETNVFSQRYTFQELKRSIWQDRLIKKGWVFEEGKYPSKTHYHNSTHVKLEIELLDPYLDIETMDRISIDQLHIVDRDGQRVDYQFKHPLAQQFYSDAIKEMDWAFFHAVDWKAAYVERHPVVMDILHYRLELVRFWLSNTFEIDEYSLIITDNRHEYKINLFTSEIEITPPKPFSSLNQPARIPHIRLDPALQRILSFLTAFGKH